jgi:hypothetical protein
MKHSKGHGRCFRFPKRQLANARLVNRRWHYLSQSVNANDHCVVHLNKLLTVRQEASRH